MFVDLGWAQIIGLIAAVTMPMWNIPFIIRIIQQKSAKQISLMWLFGIWGSIVLMLPSSFKSADPVLRLFGLSNFILFSAVVVVVMMYRKK